MWKTIIATVALAVMAVQAQAARVTVNGQSIHYTVRGTGKAIIFVHGWTCDETSWSGQVPALAGRYRVITLDLPGHGKSSQPVRGDFSMNAFAQAVEAVRVAARVDRAVLVGHSMGAGVVRTYALRHPDRVAGLVAVDGLLDVRPFAGWPVDRTPMTLDARRRLVDSMFVPQTPQPLRARIRKMMLGTPAATANGSGGSMFEAANQSQRTISAPALTIFAGKPLFPIKENTKEMLPNWSWSQVGGTGHFLMMERPKEVNRLIATFVADKAQY